MAAPVPHVSVTGPTRAARRVTAEMVVADFLSDCHRRRHGPYTGIGAILRTIVPEALDTHRELVRRHDVEILSLAPELRDRLEPSRETLTSLAVPTERTRYYAANRTRRLAHGVTEFLNSYLIESGRGRVTLAFDSVEEADSGEQELLAILLRRADPERLRIVVGSNGGSLTAELAAALDTYARPVTATAATSPGPTGDSASTAEHARRYVESDCTSDIAAEREAYESLPAEERAVLHDARADELERSGLWSARLGAIPYHREHGSAPRTEGAKALRGAVRYLQDMGFYPSVVELGSRALALLDPEGQQKDYVDIAFMMTMALAAMQRADEAEAIYFDLRSRYTDPLVHLNANYALGMIYTRHRAPERRDHELARVHLNAAIAYATLLGGEQGAFHQAFHRNGLALVEMHLGNLPTSLELVDWGVAHLDNHLGPNEHLLHRSVLLHNRAQVHLALGRVEEGVADLNRVIDADPNYPEYHFDRGNLNRRLGDHEAALADYTRAIELSPPFPELHYNRADLLAVMGDTAAAIAEFGYVLELEPDHLDARINRATLLFESGDVDAAAAEVEVGLSFHPGDPHLLCTRGLVEQEIGHAAAARLSFTAALQADPSMRAALSNRAVLAFEAGDVEQAIADLTKALEQGGDDADVLYNRGFAHQHAGNYEAAITDYSRALEVAGADRAELLYRRGSCHAAAGRSDLAAADLRAGLDAAPAELAAEIEAVLGDLVDA